MSSVSRLHDDTARGPSSTFAHYYGRTGKQVQAQFQTLLNIGTVILEVNCINKDAT